MLKRSLSIVFILILLSSSSILSESSCHSHSTFIPRDITTNNLIQHTLTLYWWYRVIHEKHDAFITVQASPFVQRSTNGDEIARFFLPCNQCDVSVKEDGTGDIASLWLNLMAPDGQFFDGSFSINPRRTLIGAYINIRINWQPKVGAHLWSDIAFAAMKSKHELRLCECPSTSAGVACDVATICQALNQEDWEFGRFCPETQTTSGIDNVEFKFGYDWLFRGQDAPDHISPYFTATAPTGKSGSAECLFEPAVGGKITGVGFGVIFDYMLYDFDDDEQELAILSDFKYLYGLTSCEKRSFDLCKNGDWSRYLQVAHKDAPSNSLPGINLFTQDVQVRLRSRIDWWVAAHYRHKNWDIEVGYDLWWQQQERVTLCDLPTGFGIYDMPGDCDINPTTASCATMCQSLVYNPIQSDATFVELNVCDLDIESGTMPRSLTNSVYGAFGYDTHICTLPTLFGLCICYESSVDFNALSNWTVWGKIGVSY